MGIFAPPIEITDDRNLLGIWRPHGKISPFHIAAFHRMSTQFTVQPVMGAFFKKVDVLLVKKAYIMIDVLHFFLRNNYFGFFAQKFGHDRILLLLFFFGSKLKPIIQDT